MNNISFNKIVLKANQSLPVDSTGKVIDLSGSIALTRDSKPRGRFLHCLIWLIQKIHAVLFGKKVDPFMMHGLLILGNDPKKEDHLIIAHSVFSGIQTASRNYLKMSDVTEMVIYIPKDEKLRQMLINYGFQTAYTAPQFRKENRLYGKEHPQFSIYDMATSAFNCRRGAKTKEAISRISYVAADLLLGNQILDKKGKPASFYCTPYIFSMLQASALIRGLKQREVKRMIKGHSRDQIAGIIASKIQNPRSGLSHIYQTPICKRHPQWVMSSYASRALDKLSTP